MSKPTIAFLGLGAMGSRMAANLVGAGYSVRAYNRSQAAIAPLAAKGATAAMTPGQAASGADIIVSILRDDDASRAVWLDPETGALASMSPNTLAIDSGTVTSQWLHELQGAAAKKDVAILAAPVAGSRPQAEAGELVFFVGGEGADLERARPILDVMGKAVVHTGTIESAAVVKLVVNALFGAQVAALAEMLAMAKSNGVAMEALLPILAELPTTSPALRGIGALMAAEKHDPLFPIELVHKDLSYACDHAETSPIIAAVRDQFAAAEKNGLGEKNLTAIAEFYGV